MCPRDFRETKGWRMQGVAGIRRRLGPGEASFGGWMQIGHPVVAQILAGTGLDWVAVDLEHGAVDISQCLALARILEGGGCVPLARIPHNDRIWIRRALDVGFRGLIVPLVNDASEAAFAARIAKYPPEGERGIGFAPANDFGERISPACLADANRALSLIVQIETAYGVENLDAILDVPDVDGIFIGPYDLSGSYGVLGEFDHPLMREARRRCLDACRQRGKLAGVHVVQPDPDEVRARIAEGFNLIALSLDVTLLQHGARALAAAAREAAGAGEGAR